MGVFMTTSSLLQNAQIIHPEKNQIEQADLYLKDGKIQKIAKTISVTDCAADTCVKDLKGAFVAPGLVDLRVNIGEPGFEQKETIQTACDAAVAGGITSFAATPHTAPLIDDVAGVEYIARRGRQTKLTKIYPLATITQKAKGTELTEIGMLKEAGAVGFYNGKHSFGNAKSMIRALNYSKIFKAVLHLYPQEPSLSTGASATSSIFSSRLGLSGVSAKAEIMQIERDLHLIEMTGGQCHFINISTKGGIEAIRAAKAKGLNVTCDTAPQYFSLNELDIGEYRTFFKLQPPLRDEEDRLAVLEAVADGTIDAITSDHTPEDQDSKRLPYEQAEAGATGLETLFGLSLDLYHKGLITLPELFQRLSTKPAQILGVEGGKIAIGASADLVIFDPDLLWRADATQFKSKSQNTPFDGRPLVGRTIATYIDGRLVYEYKKS